MPLRFTFRQLEYFVAVGNAGSIALASERINISSPSISAAISQLEQEFDIQLFVRQHAQGVSLTPAGKRFFNEAKLLLDQAYALHDVAADIGERVYGPLNIGCFVTMAPMLLPELRRSFEIRHPGAQVSQVEAHHAQLLNMLMRAEIDIALTYDLQIPAEVAFEPLAALPPYALFAENDPAARAHPVELKELAALPLVFLDLPYSRDYFLSLFQKLGLKPNIVERTHDISILRTMVANGYGYGLANVRTLMPHAPDGKPLVTAPLAGDYRPMILGSATVRSERKTRVLRAFEEHCRETVNDRRIPGMIAAG